MPRACGRRFPFYEEEPGCHGTPAHSLYSAAVAKAGLSSIAASGSAPLGRLSSAVQNRRQLCKARRRGYLTSPTGLGAALRCSPARRRDRGEQGPGRLGRRGISRAARSGSATRRDFGMTRARKAGDTATAGAAGAYPGRREGSAPKGERGRGPGSYCLSRQSKRALGRQKASMVRLCRG